MNDINGIMERAEERHKQLARLIEKMLDKSEAILQAGQPHEQTNDEWRKTCSTEEFAEFLFDIRYDYQVPWKNKGVIEWLKQPHTFK